MPDRGGPFTVDCQVSKFRFSGNMQNPAISLFFSIFYVCVTYPSTNLCEHWWKSWRTRPQYDLCNWQTGGCFPLEYSWTPPDGRAETVRKKALLKNFNVILKCLSMKKGFFFSVARLWLRGKRVALCVIDTFSTNVFLLIYPFNLDAWVCEMGCENLNWSIFVLCCSCQSYFYLWQKKSCILIKLERSWLWCWVIHIIQKCLSHLFHGSPSSPPLLMHKMPKKN